MSDELIAFRQGFCQKAAELGCLPSELLDCMEYMQLKQAAANNKSAGILGDAASGIGSGLKDVIYAAPGTYLTAAALAAAGGLGAGGLGAYLMNKGQEELDPDSAIFKEELPKDDEVKKLHLIAKYHQAMNELQNPNS